MSKQAPTTANAKKGLCDATKLEARVKYLEARVKILEAQIELLKPLPLSREQLEQIANLILPIIENKIFGKPEIDLDKITHMTSEERTRFVARMLRG